MAVASGISSFFVGLLIRQLYSWLPPGLFLCVIAVISTFFFVVFLKLITVILHFFFSFIELLKP